MNDWTNDSITMNRFLKRLSAKITYFRNKTTKTIEGTLKLKSDPRVENFTESMIIRSGSIIRSSYAVCLVLYNGRSGISSKMTNIYLPKRSSIEIKIQSFSLWFLVLVIGAALLNHLQADRVSFDLLDLIDIDFGLVRTVGLYLSTFPLSLNLILTLF